MAYFYVSDKGITHLCTILNKAIYVIELMWYSLIARYKWVTSRI